MLNLLILFDALIFLGFGLSRLLEPHKTKGQFWSLAATFAGTLDFGLHALNRLHLLGNYGLDPTLGFFLDIVDGPLLWIYYLSTSETSFKLKWTHGLGLILVVVFTGLHGLYRLFHPGDIPLIWQLVLGYFLYSWFVLFQLIFLSKMAFKVWIRRQQLSRYALVNVLYSVAWTAYGVANLLLILTPYYLVAYFCGTLLFLGMILLYPIKIGGTKPDFEGMLQQKVSKSRIVGIDIAQIVHKLDEIMKNEKLFSEKTLSLGTLAERVQITPHQLSELLNQALGVTYTQYVNGWRLEEARTLLLNKPSLSVLEIAFQAGFGSKSAFNAFFVRATGMTPSEFRRSKELRETSLSL